MNPVDVPSSGDFGPGAQPFDPAVVMRLANELFRQIPASPEPAAVTLPRLEVPQQFTSPAAVSMSPPPIAGLSQIPMTSRAQGSGRPIRYGETPISMRPPIVSDDRASPFSMNTAQHGLQPHPSIIPSTPARAGIPFTMEGFAVVPSMADQRIAPGISADPSKLDTQSDRHRRYYFCPAEAQPPHYYFTPESQAAVRGQLPGEFDVQSIRRDFPILHQNVRGKPLIWMDNAATTQKPQSVIDAISHFYQHDNSNVHRGAHTLAARATNALEAGREKVQRFLGDSTVDEIVFVRGTTEAVNLVAQSFGRTRVRKGDEVLVTTLEHHSNIVPWQQLCRETGGVLRVVPVNDRGEVLLDEYEKLLGPRTRIVAITHVSNALGTVVPVKTMTEIAHRHGAKVLVDGAQAISHFHVNVQDIGCDFYAFSGHKLFGPTGIGVLYGKKEILNEMPPWQGGGNMIENVTFEETTYAPLPAKFEAGTGILAGAVGLGAAIDYLDFTGMENIAQYEHRLLAYATEKLSSIPGLRLIGTAADKVSVLSFILDGIPVEAMGTYLDSEGIAVRAGHHCAQPALARFGLKSTVRPSLALYNTLEEIDSLVAAIRKARRG
jgi:cysteine desulfurase / selenocysteine lyase